MSVAGLATARFCFEGFLPTRTSARRRHLQGLSAERRTLVFYESPRRILQAVADLAAEFGPERPAVLARELTKIHETVMGGTLAELQDWLAEHDGQRRGEFVIVVAGAAPDQRDEETTSVSAAELLRVLVEELTVSQAVSVAARLTGGKRNALYRQAIALVEAGKEDTGSGDQEK